MAVTPGIYQATSVCNREMRGPTGAVSQIAGRRFLYATAGREVKLSDQSSIEKLISTAGIRFKTGRSGNWPGPDL